MQTKGHEDPPLAQNFPSYRKPPVDEVYCGMRFHVPDALRITHYGLLWDKFRVEYPNVQHNAPIASGDQILIDAAVGAPFPRVWFVNKTDNNLLQFQVDRFYFNWRRRNDSYPRYSYVIDKFESAKSILENFYRESQLGELKPIEYELNYINHIPKGEGWESLNDLGRVFKDFAWVQNNTRFLPNPSAVAWSASFQLPDGKGDLRASLKQGTRRGDNVKILVLELTARGVVEQMGDILARQWFDTAHEWIVKGFTDLTTTEIQTTIWERENAST